MTNQETTEKDTPAQASDGLGKALKTAREAKRFTQIDLADKLKLHVTIIEYLELEQFEALPVPAFVRGYIRAIALELDADVDELIQIYAEHNQSDPNLGSTSAAEKQKKSTDPVMVWFTLAILLAVVVLLIVWGVNSLGETAVEPADNTSEVLPSTLPDIQLSLNPNMFDSEVGENTELPLVNSDLTVPTEVTPASINNAAPQGSDSLVIKASGPSWADIRDASGFKLVYGLLDQADQQQRLTGTAPFSVFLGDAKQIELIFQGKRFDFSEHLRANNVAKFSVE